MKKEQDDKLCSTFPLLYRDRYANMQTTCMCWGFPGGKNDKSGWFDLIWELSSKLEPLIQKYLDKHKPTDCANCGCDQKFHGTNALDIESNLGQCDTVHQLPYCFSWKWKFIGWPSKAQNWNDRWKIFKTKYVYYGLIQRIKNWISYGINFVLDNVLHQQFRLTKYKPCWCKKFLLNHPCASQVKEKFGSLRFYLTSGTEEMWALTHEFELRSETICQDCGAPGELRNDYHWLSTLCEKCAMRDSKRIPTAKEVDEDDLLKDNMF